MFKIIIKRHNISKIKCVFKKAKKNDDENDLNFYPKGYLSKGKELDLFHDEYIPVEENKSKDKEKERSISKHTLLRNKSEKSFTYYNSILKRNEGLDPFKYNPNYNSIYKNTPSVRITKPLNETIPVNKIKYKKNLNKISLKTYDASPFLTEIGNKSMTTSYSLQNKKNKNYDLSDFDNKLLNNIKNYRKLKKEENDRSNHSIRFDKYVDRKIMKTEINPNVSYLNQYDYQKARNNSLDFSKMHSRDDYMFLNANNQINSGRWRSGNVIWQKQSQNAYGQ